MAYLLGFIPTVRGFIALAIAGAMGAWLGGNKGATMAVTAVVALAFLKPNLSMWLESILFAVRTGFFAIAGFKALLAFGPVAHTPLQVQQALALAAVGAVAQVRIWWLIRRGELCPIALGTTKWA